MRWLWLLIGLLVSVGASAQSSRLLLESGGGQRPTLDCNFAAFGSAAQSAGFITGIGPKCPRISFTRASVANYFDQVGILRQAASGVPRPAFSMAGVAQGLQVEEARTNVVLWNRDLTNAAWTLGATMTSAKNQTGIDGVSNSASSITGGAVTATNTICQAITLASSARFQSAYVKRLVGSGTVSMSMDGGSTHTTITVPATWGLVSIPTQTLANPGPCFKITTNAGSIGVDFVDNENGTFGTSPIAVTTTAATRQADYTSMPVTSFPFNGANMTVVISFIPEAINTAITSLGGIVDIAGGSTVRIRYNANVIDGIVQNALVNHGPSSSSFVPAINTAFGSGISYTPAISYIAAGGILGGTGTANNYVFPTTTSVQIGNRTNDQFANGWFRRFQIYPFAMNATQLRAATQ